MKIAVNTRLLIKDKLDGIGLFSFETLKIITQKHPEHQFYFLFDRKFDQDFIFSDNITPIVLFPQARHPFLFYWWFEFSVARALKKIKPDLFLSPDGYLSLSTNVKSLAVIHDLNFEHYPKDIPFLNRLYYRFFFPKYARKAKRIATVSEFSKNDISQKYGIEKEKIDVVYNGVSKAFQPVSERTKIETRNKYTKGEKYFLFVSSLLPRKNLVNLFRAFDLFKTEQNGTAKLLVVGQKKWWSKEMEKVYNHMNYKHDVVFAGRLSDKDLAAVMASALALTYVSYFEGFGIPILEAYQCQVPVICSDITSMPEIAGDAAVLVDPFSPMSIKDAMGKIYSDENLRNELIKKGNERVKNFSWEKTADRLWDSILKSAEE